MKLRLFLSITALATGAIASAQPRMPLPPPPMPVDIGPPPPQVPNPLTNEVEPAGIPVAQADLVMKSGSDTVYFAPDQFTLDPVAQMTLAAHARWLMVNQAVRVSVEGHGDARDTREHSLALGERRANAVRDFLMQQGIPAARLQTVSWGKERPAILGSSDVAQAQNSRAQTVIIR